MTKKKTHISKPFAAIVLAAGLGKRMKSDLPKVLAQVAGKPILTHIIKTLDLLTPTSISIVIGHKGELVKEATASLSTTSAIIYSVQKEQKGTGDAARVGLESLKDFSGIILILPGDAPLISSQTLSELINFHETEKATLSFLSFPANNPSGYGRIIRDSKDVVLEIREEKDCSDIQRKITEVNSGIYIVDSFFLEPALNGLNSNNAQGELYLTDIVARAIKEGQHVAACCLDRETEFLGINSQAQLSMVNKIANQNKIEQLLEAGVIIKDPLSLYLDDDVTVGSGTKIGPNVQLLGNTKVGNNVVIEGSAFILDSTIEDQATLKFSLRLEGALIGKRSSVGPFAHLRPGAILDEEVKIGNFVEIKKTYLKKGAKASHLTYLGDTEVGENANIGAGTITCNYDGHEKFKTIIGDGAFIGSNTSLIAPVNIGARAVIGAGSAITKDVAADSLALTRSEQKTIEGWSKKKAKH